MRLPNLRSAASRTPARLPGLTFGSVSSLLSVALWAAFWILALLTLATLILFIVMAFVPMGPMGLTATSDDGGTSVPVPRAYILFGIGAFAGYFGGFTLILRHLRIGQQVAGLAVQFAAQGVQGGEADGAGLAGLEDRQIGQGHAHAIGQLGQRHAPFEQDAVKLDADGHDVSLNAARRMEKGGAF